MKEGSTEDKDEEEEFDDDVETEMMKTVLNFQINEVPSACVVSLFS